MAQSANSCDVGTTSLRIPLKQRQSYTRRQESTLLSLVMDTKELVIGLEAACVGCDVAWECYCTFLDAELLREAVLHGIRWLQSRRGRREVMVMFVSREALTDERLFSVSGRQSDEFVIGDTDREDCNLFLVGEWCDVPGKGIARFEIQRQAEQKNCEELCQLVLRYYRRVLERSCHCCQGVLFAGLDPQRIAAASGKVATYQDLKEVFQTVNVVPLHEGSWMLDLAEFESSDVEDDRLRDSSVSDDEDEWIKVPCKSR
ncbi:hypothetical protein F5144DRAFT_586384 [Chaetomium tenue]|uniref:Uncharacterized protein n=1 Tax=Chaetomium tenue TaxID=1854479 RepID=A0ACB7NW04_9PEZI|nr:hypothetical protein F5144DRAFT_586384 [Chaetomium globosum]